MDLTDGDPGFTSSGFVSQVATSRATSSTRRPFGSSTYRFTSIDPFIVPRLSRIYFDPTGSREGKRTCLDIGRLLLTRKALRSQCGGLASVPVGGGQCPLSPAPGLTTESPQINPIKVFVGQSIEFDPAYAVAYFNRAFTHGLKDDTDRAVGVAMWAAFQAAQARIAKMEITRVPL